jgi:hypothetical protein
MRARGGALESSCVRSLIRPYTARCFQRGAHAPDSSPRGAHGPNCACVESLVHDLAGYRVEEIRKPQLGLLGGRRDGTVEERHGGQDSQKQNSAQCPPHPLLGHAAWGRWSRSGQLRCELDKAAERVRKPHLLDSAAFDVE